MTEKKKKLSSEDKALLLAKMSLYYKKNPEKLWQHALVVIATAEILKFLKE